MSLSPLSLLLSQAQVMSLIDDNSSLSTAEPTLPTDPTESSTTSTAIPSPQLKEINLTAHPPESWRDFYLQTISLVDRLYHDCRLVHGDLSEYNLLLHSPSLTVYAIDFGQSVDTSHPQQREYLQRDVQTILLFFQRKGVDVHSEGRILSSIESGDRHFHYEREEDHRRR
jgi:serine/threonine-protein kinase RIO1